MTELSRKSGLDMTAWEGIRFAVAIVTIAGIAYLVVRAVLTTIGEGGV